jgi:hypothetical protein
MGEWSFELKPASWFEEVANHPKVFSRIEVAGVKSADFSEWWDSHGIGLGWDDGGFIFYRDGADWEVHTLFLPGHAPVLERAKEAIRFAFASGAERVVTMTPADLAPAIRLAENVGFSLMETVNDGWPRTTGPVDLLIWELKPCQF